MAESVRVELGDNDWADIHPKLLHGTARRIEDAIRKYVKVKPNIAKLAELSKGQAEQSPKTLGGDGGTTVQFVEKEGEVKTNILAEVEVDFDHINYTESTQIMILNQTKAWSFGAVTLEVLDTVDEAKFIELQKEMDSRYGKIPLLGMLGGVSLKASS